MRTTWLVLVFGIAAVGCEGRQEARDNLKQIGLASQNLDDGGPQRVQMQQQMGERQKQGGAVAAAAPESVARKIIFNARLDLLVDKLDQAERDLQRLVKEQGGYIAQSEVSGSPGAPRSGTWTIRVPVEHFQAMRDALLGLGEMHQSRVDSDDITDQFYDLSARIKNKQQEENRLLDLLKKSTGNLKDILSVEENITRVRGDIEQMQGQLQRWDKQSALATVVVGLQDKKDYVSPSNPAFGTSVGRTFTGSVQALLQFCRGVVLVLVAVSPWLVVALVVLAPLWWLLPRARRRGAVPGGTVAAP